jgi:hypothetical protein
MQRAGDELQIVGGICGCESGGKPPHSKEGEGDDGRS